MFMTLIARNKMLLTIFIICILIFIFTAVIFTIAAINGQITAPTLTSRLFPLPNLPFFQYNFLASLISAIILTIFTSATICIIYINFEKTQAPEIIYFCFFLIGCIIETTRIWFPIYNLWKNFSIIYIVASRILFFGRMLSTLSLTFLVLFSINQNIQQNENKNCLIITAAAAVFSTLIPVDTITIPSNCAVRFGYEKMFLGICIFCFVAAYVSMRLYATSIYSKEYKKASLGYFFLSFGYLFLTQTDCFVILFLGATFFIGGTIIFLRNLHRYHIWK